MFSVVNFNEYINGVNIKRDDYEVYKNIIQKISNDEYYICEYNGRKTWFCIYCDVNNKWYTTESLDDDNNKLTKGELLVTDNVPAFFAEYWVIIDYSTRKTYMSNHDIVAEAMDDFVTTLNGILHLVGSFCYYQDNDDKKFYITSDSYVNFRETKSYVDYNNLPIDGVIDCFFSYDDYLIVLSSNKYYISCIETPYAFYELTELPTNNISTEEMTRIYMESAER